MDNTEGFVLERVSVVRGQARLLDDVSARLPAGQCTAVVGPSGAGKSTLLRLLNRLEEPSSGSILLTGEVAEELRVGRADLSETRLADLLERVGLTGFAARRTAELSGGEAQRVCLARALAVEPEVLLLDEPTSAFDGLNASFIADLVRDHVATGRTAVLVSHDLAVVRSAADHALVLDRGLLVAAGNPGEVDYLETR